MFTINKYRPRVNILLEPGIYILPTKSATGKSYLARLLYKYGEFCERCTSYSHSSYYKPDDILDASKYDVVLLDRYDMYPDVSKDKMREFAESGILLVDAKGYLSGLRFKLCCLLLHEDRITVCP